MDDSPSGDGNNKAQTAKYYSSFSKAVIFCAVV
jgi:hypothetical protein